MDQGINDIAEKGVTAEEIEKVVKYELKTFADNQKENAYWEGNITNYIRWNNNDVEGYEEAYKTLTSAEIQKFAKEVILPEKKNLHHGDHAPRLDEGIVDKGKRKRRHNTSAPHQRACPHCRAGPFDCPFNCPSTLKRQFPYLERAVSPLTATQGQPAFSIFYHIYRTRLKYLL